MLHNHALIKIVARTDDLDTAQAAATKIMGAVFDTLTQEVWTPNNPLFIPRFIEISGEVA